MIDTQNNTVESAAIAESKCTILPTVDDIRAMYRNDLVSFIQFTFNTLYPGKPFLPNWHIDVMADRLMDCMAGKTKRLIINVPPRYLKSITVSVAFVAYLLGHDPSKQIMCISYGEELTKELAKLTRALMQADKYRWLFPNTYVQQQGKLARAEDLKTTKNGRRLAISAGGPITGRGADVIIIDDPLKASAARTKELDNINTWFDDNIYQRLNNKNDGVIILVMQRLHVHDLTGHLLDKEEHWAHLCIPAISEQDERYPMRSGIAWTREQGMPILAAHESLTKLEQVKQNQGAYTFAAQYQQNPAADSECLVKAVWFKAYCADELMPVNKAHAANGLPRGMSVLQSWDTAFKSENSADYSVGITIGLYQKRLYILDVCRQRADYPVLLKLIKDQHQRYKPRVLLVEDKASGQNIIASLRHERIPVKAYQPQGDKYERMAAASADIESGLVLLPENAAWKDTFLLEITRFPHVKHDDQVDALSQAVLWQRSNSLTPRMSEYV